MLWDRLAQFLFPARSDTWLAILRIGLALQILVYCLSLRRDWGFLFATRGYGLISRELSEALLESPLIPRLGWLVAVGNQFDLTEGQTLSIAWTALLCASFALLLGLFCRAAAVVTWLLYLCATKSGQLLAYGLDNFTTIGLFYLMLSPLPDHLSLDYRIRKVPAKDPRLLGFFQRVLQLHLCVIYFFSGLVKCLGSGWWNGSNIWRALTRPPFDLIEPEILVRWKFVLPLIGIFVCLLEIGYPLFIRLKQTRFLWLTAVVAMHVAIGTMMRMYLFALVMIVLNVAAFGPEVFVSKQAKLSQF